MRFSRSTHLPMCLSLETLTSIIRTGLPILVELIDLVFCYNFSAASEFCVWVQVGIDVYIPHRKYQVKPHSSTWFSAACTAAIIHRNHFFNLYQKDKSSESKVKFRQASNRCKRVL